MVVTPKHTNPYCWYTLLFNNLINFVVDFRVSGNSQITTIRSAVTLSLGPMGRFATEIVLKTVDILPLVTDEFYNILKTNVNESERYFFALNLVDLS